MASPGKVIDLFGFVAEGSVGQQFPELDDDPIPIPARARRKADGNGIVQGAEQQRRPIVGTHIPRLGDEDAVLRSEVADERGFRRQSREERKLIMRARPSQVRKPSNSENPGAHGVCVMSCADRRIRPAAPQLTSAAMPDMMSFNTATAAERLSAARLA